MSFISAHRFTRQQARNQFATLLSLLLFDLENAPRVRTRHERTTREATLLGLLRFALDDTQRTNAIFDKLCHAMVANDWLFVVTSDKVRQLLQDGLSVEHAQRVQQHHDAVRRASMQ